MSMKYSSCEVRGEVAQKISPTTFVAELAFVPIKPGSVEVLWNEKILATDHPKAEEFKLPMMIPFKWSLNYENGLLTVKFKDKVKGKISVNYQYQYESGPGVVKFTLGRMNAF
jgi:hypothetical protein